MKAIYHRDIPQGSDDWFALRREVPTASCAKQIITKTGKLAAARTNYMAQLFAEAVCPQYAEDEISSPAIEWGNTWEPVARAEFEKHIGSDVDQLAFITTENGRAGCSPDGIIMVNGEPVAGLEIKCPYRPANHVATIAAGEMPAEHKPQVHWSMAVTGLSAWHFWSYFPGLPPFHQLIRRDDYTEKVEHAMMTFGNEYAEYRKMMETRMEETA